MDERRIDMKLKGKKLCHLYLFQRENNMADEVDQQIVADNHSELILLKSMNESLSTFKEQNKALSLRVET